MKKLTNRQREDYELTRIKPPEDYQAMSTEQRSAFVAQELATGNHVFEESLSIEDLFYFAGKTGGESPEYFLYRQIMARKDPAVVESNLVDELDFVFFFEIYGHDLAKTHLSSAKLLETYGLLDDFGDDIHVTDEDVKTMLEERGAAVVGADVSNTKLCKLFVEVFSLKALNHVPRDVANKFKGKHLEDGLGL